MSDHARGVARQLVAVTRGGALESPLPDGPLELLGDPDQRTRLRAVLRELVSATATMMLNRAEYPLNDHAYLLDLRDAEGVPVRIDDLSPPVRALVRAVLAELNGNPEDAEDQLDLAIHPDERYDPLDVLILALLWTVGSIEWCEEHDAPTPGWLR